MLAISTKNLIKKPLINNRIRAREVRLIDETGKQLGIVELTKALQIAKERNLDLIQVTDKVEPPVCKILDYGKYLYQLQKKERDKKTQKTSEIKGIRLRFNISPHDLETRANQAEKFLKKGNIIKIEMILRGREKGLTHFAKEKIKHFVEILNEKIPVKIEGDLKRAPHKLMMIVSLDRKQQQDNKKASK
jgi:translation initiation factor IF-3